MKKKIQTSRHVATSFMVRNGPEIEVIKAKLLVSKRPLNKAVTSKYDEIITTLEIALS